ncbi:hypothetical protein [Amycolatopsis sp. cmx-11-12]|uniref:hypothetical protein n=1 Tax=Amycolatopsis sp. cmx-11-12 TaxID=2785795 RepID=UPI003918603B
MLPADQEVGQDPQVCRTFRVSADAVQTLHSSTNPSVRLMLDPFSAACGLHWLRSAHDATDTEGSRVVVEPRQLIVGGCSLLSTAMATVWVTIS